MRWMSWRIEAGIFDNGTDLDKGLTPSMAGLEKFVDFGNETFIGREALISSKPQRLLFGIMTDALIPKQAPEKIYEVVGYKKMIR